MNPYECRPMRPEEWVDVANLIFTSTNAWYVANGRPPIFGGQPADARLFCEVYEALDPGCCLLAVERTSGAIGGSCFYHPRPTHVSLGIMNVHPEHFGKGIARQLLARIVELAEAEGKPLRLVSSAMNLDSFSLYNRAGFVPRAAFQDMLLAVPKDGMPREHQPPGFDRVRPAIPEDLPAMAALERELHHIERPDDYRYFLKNEAEIWRVSIIEGENGTGLNGFLCSVNHPGSRMLGPGVMRTQEDAAALIFHQLDQHRGGMPVWLVPVDADRLVRQLYGWGARNCELHFSQVRGAWRRPEGIIMPTFMPESS